MRLSLSLVDPEICRHRLLEFTVEIGR